MKLERMMAVLLLAAMAVLPAMALGAEEGGASLAIDATYAGRYIWRGIPINEEAVLQPSLTVSGSGLSLNLWGNLDLTDWGEDAGYGDENGNVTEIDYTGAYTITAGPAAISLGFAAYTFPNQDEIAALSTTEAFLGVALDVPGSPSLRTYVDMEGEATVGVNYTSLDLGHTFELADWLGLRLSGHLGYANDKFFQAYFGLEDEEGAFSDWSAGVALPITLPHGFALTPAYLYNALLESDTRDLVSDVWERDPEAGIFLVTLGWAGDI